MHGSLPCLLALVPGKGALESSTSWRSRNRHEEIKTVQMIYLTYNNYIHDPNASNLSHSHQYKSQKSKQVVMEWKKSAIKCQDVHHDFSWICDSFFLPWASDQSRVTVEGCSKNWWSKSVKVLQYHGPLQLQKILKFHKFVWVLLPHSSHSNHSYLWLNRSYYSELRVVKCLIEWLLRALPTGDVCLWKLGLVSCIQQFPTNHLILYSWNISVTCDSRLRKLNRLLLIWIWSNLTSPPQLPLPWASTRMRCNWTEVPWSQPHVGEGEKPRISTPPGCLPWLILPLYHSI